MYGMEKQFIYEHEGKEYIVYVTYKTRMRSIRYYYRSGHFLISCPLFVRKKTLVEGLDKFFDRLVKEDPRNTAEGEDFIFIFGNKFSISERGSIPFSNGESLVYKSRDDLKRKLHKWFLQYLTVRTEYYEGLMGIKPYKVRLRKMSSRYGSNSSMTHSITYSTILIHYSKEIIDSVIVHELAHQFQRNHSQKFYDKVLEYCPNYKTLHKKLGKGEFQ